MIKNKKYINQRLEDKLDKINTFSKSDEQLDATTLIAKIDKIDTAKAYKKVEKRIDGRTRFIQFSQQLTKIAAVLFVPVLFLSIWLYLNNANNKPPQPTQYTVNCPLGIKTQLVLPDGSKVWLNSGTTLKYDYPFINKMRQVELSGEAYFSVEKSEVPFIIQSANTAVQVYGTKFNVKSYEIENKIEVALQEGSIGFSVLNGQDEIRLIPNDFLVFNKGDQSIKTVNKNISRHLAWRQNQLIFDETPLAEMARTLERWYGIDVEIKGNDLLKYKFTATFENESLLQVIELLELSSPIGITYKSARLDGHSNIISKAKIIIYKKT